MQNHSLPGRATRFEFSYVQETNQWRNVAHNIVNTAHKDSFEKKTKKQRNM